MIRHIVLLQIPSHIARDKIDSMFDQLQQIALAMPGTVAFCSGANMPGSGLHQGFTHVINIDFIDETAVTHMSRNLIVTGSAADCLI